MAKITRVDGNLKAFASEQLTNERTLFGQTAQADDLTSQITAQFLRGWGIIGPSDQPSLQDFNALGYTMGQLLAYLHQMGVAEYNAAQEYYIGSVTQIGGVIYISKTAANIGNAPATSPTFWGAIVMPSQATESVAGITALASSAEALAGVDDTKSMTALKTKQAIASAAAPLPQGIRGAASNLQVSSSGSSAAVVLTADRVTLENASGVCVTRSSVSVTINTAATGVNGLAIGTLAASTWYAVWLWDNGTTLVGTIDPSFTAPTAPAAGYVNKGRFSAIRTDATANKYPLGFMQKARRAQYRVASGTNIAALPFMATGSQGNVSTPVWQPVNTANYIPPSAVRVICGISGGSSNSVMIAAPNNQYSGYTSITNPPPILLNASQAGAYADFILESGSIYYASNSGSSAMIACLGWEDTV